MNEFRRRLDELNEESQKFYDLSINFNVAEHGNEYKRIRSDAIELLAEAKTKLPQKELAEFKKLVIDFLCKYCGCHLDMDVLEHYTPDVLSVEDFEFIKYNSALARWF